MFGKMGGLYLLQGKVKTRERVKRESKIIEKNEINRKLHVFDI